MSADMGPTRRGYKTAIHATGVCVHATSNSLESVRALQAQKGCANGGTERQGCRVECSKTGAKSSREAAPDGLVRRSSGPSAGPRAAPAATINSKERKPSTEATQTLHFPSAGLTVRYAYASQRGFYPNDTNKANQDSLCLLPFFGGEREHALFAVFDGHGEFGAQCAQFARDKVPDNLLVNLNMLAPDVAFIRAMLQTNTQLHQQPHINDCMSGTTAVSALLCGSILYVANVGDSRCVIAERQDDKLVARDLSTDQTPFRRDECERVKRCGARVMTLEQLEGHKDPHIQYWGLEENNSGDPPRLWAPNASYPGTAFTRSIGDSTAEIIGVIAEPEVSMVQVTPASTFLVIASDGVWEFMSSQAVVNMVAEHDDPQDACLSVVAESARLWLQNETRTDDITIIVVQFQHSDEDTRPYVDASRLSSDMPPGRQWSSGQQPLPALSSVLGADGSHSPVDVRRELSMRALEAPMSVPTLLSSFSVEAAGSSPAQAAPPTIPNHVLQALAGASISPSSTTAAGMPWALAPGVAAGLVSRSAASFSGFSAPMLGATMTSLPSFTAGSLPLQQMSRPGLSHAGSGTIMASASSSSLSNTAQSSGVADTKFLDEALESHCMFRHLTPQQRQAICSQFERQSIQAGELVYKQGDNGDRFYVVSFGHFEALKQRPDAASADLVATFSYQPGAPPPCFGELALLYPKSRRATVVARTDGVLWTLHRLPYKQLLQHFDTAEILGVPGGVAPSEGNSRGSRDGRPTEAATALAASELQELVQVLQGMDVLRCLSNSQLYSCAAATERITLADGQAIVQQGSEVQDFYLVQSGTMVCTVLNGSTQSADVVTEVVRLTAGQIFGEHALLGLSVARATSAVAQGPVTLRRLNKAKLEAVVGGSLQDVQLAHDRWQEALAGQQQALAELVSLPDWANGPEVAFSLHDLAARGLLFSTDSSALMLMEHKQSQDILTVRVTSVADVTALGKQAQVLRARAITRSLQPFTSIPQVIYSFKDSSVLAEVLFTVGLCTLDLLLAPSPLDEPSAAFVAASVILGLEHLAWSGVIFRGLSAHTILVTESGQIQLVDFRFARLDEGRAYTLCGNPEYMAPEVIQGRRHDEAVDLWALGVLIYAMLAGRTPFAAPEGDELLTYSKILSGQRAQAPHFSLLAADLIDRLLRPQPKQRLGAGPLGLAALKAHPWFAGIDWQALAEHRVEPPAGLHQRVNDFEGVECAEFDPKPCAADSAWIQDF